jgi:hypothetical protein
MAECGLVVNARGAWPDNAEIAALGAKWLRTIVYNLNELDMALNVLQAAPSPPRVIALINSETDTVGNNLAGWISTMQTIATSFAGRLAAVECLNEWDLTGYTADVAVARASQAAQILAGSGIGCLLGSVAGPNWVGELAAANALLDATTRSLLAGACFHPYGQRARGRPAGWGFGEADAAVTTAFAQIGLPIWLTECGIRINDADGTAGQARYVTDLYGALNGLPAAVPVPVACYFCWRDDIGAPSERGPFGFGLRDMDGRDRPAWADYAAVSGGNGNPGQPRPPLV